MTSEALIAIAKREAGSFHDPEGRCPGLNELPNTRILDAVVVYFESCEHDGRIEVFLEKDSGKIVTALMIPRAKPTT